MNETNEFREAGQGDPVICLLGDEGCALRDALADDFAVLSKPVRELAGADTSERADALLSAAIARGCETFSLVAHGADASIALCAALRAPEVVNRIVLLSPLALDAGGVPNDGALAGKFSDVKQQVLALFGTRSSSAPPSMGGHYKRALPACHLTYVFDADDTSRERLEAVSEVVFDFLKRGDAFLVNNKDGRVHA